MVLSKTFSALSDANRQRIVSMLKERDMTVTEMAEQLGVTMPTVSHHLDVLKHADLITPRRQGQNVFYSLNLSVVEEVMQKIAEFLVPKK
ncbi:MAG: Transcriptional regulator, ArsR family [candidate division TM6 bacterium GW2011_GWE2_41_16]|nr:MAG: Transcriptional regulator, ArsR family [candidate division TM6 bacterium GW2011_GWE2_41_16]